MFLGHHVSNVKVYGRHARNSYTSRQSGVNSSRFSLIRSISDTGPDFARLQETLLAQGPAGALDISSLSSSTVSSTSSERNGSNTLLQTPLPTETAGSEVFKLGGSRPIPDHPGNEFSPVPYIQEGISDVTTTGILVGHPMERSGKTKPVKRSHTSSRSKKENMQPKIPNSKAHISSMGLRKTSRLGLASPFVSRPSSPSGNTPHKVDSPQNNVNQKSLRAPRGDYRSGLTDRGPNSSDVPLLPTLETGPKESRSGAQRRHTGHRQVISQSARTSPTRDERTNPVANSLRRPSAPSLRPPMAVLDVPSPDPSHTRKYNTSLTGGDDFNLEIENTALITHIDSYFGLFERNSEIYFASSLGTVDFNRPPSQMSMHAFETDNEYAGEDFFAHIRGRSTPLRSGRFLDLLNATSDANGSLGDRHDRMGPNSVVHDPSSEINSPWISDSIISPPSYYIRHKDKISLEDNTMEKASDEMNHSRSSSLQGGASALINSVIDTAAIGHSVGIKEPRLKPKLAKLRTLGLPVAQPALNMETTCFIGEDSENISPRDQSHGAAVAGNGTLNQGSSTDGRTAGRRNRSDTIVQGGGGARRTRSGTVVQANRLERAQSVYSDDDEPQGDEETLEELCSCCSSDDELLLRSHSHFDVEAVDLAWKVAEPPSPVQKRLRRAERMYEKKKKKRRQNGRSGHLSKAVEGIENGMEDLGVDELDLLGTFLPGDW